MIRRPFEEVYDYKNLHKGKDIVVCGLGPSIARLAPLLSDQLTIGVNDIGRHLSPTYLVLQDYPTAFLQDRLEVIQTTHATCIFVAFNFPNLQAHRTLGVKLGDREGYSFGENGIFSFAKTSTYLATCLAAFMGARRIALAGVDFTGPGRFYSSPFTSHIDNCFLGLRTNIESHGRQLLNLGEDSMITSIPYIDPKTFLNRQ